MFFTTGGGNRWSLHGNQLLTGMSVSRSGIVCQWYQYTRTKIPCARGLIALHFSFLDTPHIKIWQANKLRNVFIVNSITIDCKPLSILHKYKKNAVSRLAWDSLKFKDYPSTLNMAARLVPSCCRSYLY